MGKYSKTNVHPQFPHDEKTVIKTIKIYILFKLDMYQLFWRWTSLFFSMADRCISHGSCVIQQYYDLIS